MKFDTDLNKPFSEEELDVLGLNVRNGQLFAFDVREFFAAHKGGLLGVTVYQLGPAPAEKVMNLLSAAPYMYQQFGFLFRLVEGLVGFMEQLNAASKAEYGEPDKVATALEGVLTELQNRILEARRCAVVGPVQLAEEIKRNPLTPPKSK